VLGFNSGKYDLNLIKEYFVDQITDTTRKVKVAKRANQNMFLLTPGVRFLDVMNYLGPGTSYEAWVKAYGCDLKKSWFPYEWFDSPEKLNYPGLPDYPDWYSKLKNKFLLTQGELVECKKIFEERGMKTFGDWLEYYNNLDVEPFAEALTKMRVFYQEHGIDILKDAVSLPGVSLQYLLRGTLKDKYVPLYAPQEETYKILKSHVVGGPSIVFTRYHEAGVTRIRSHQYTNPKICGKILGYDANALYLSTMERVMPCGKEKVTRYTDPEKTTSFIKRLRSGEWFGFAEVDIRVPEDLLGKFAEMSPLFHNRVVEKEEVSRDMLGYAEDTGRKRTKTKKLVGTRSAKKILLYAPLLRWYVNHGLEITAVYTTIDYQARTIFKWFVEEVTKARREGDTCKEKELLASVYKLLGNSAYGKMIEVLERQTNVIFTQEEKVVDTAQRSPFFDASGFEEIGESYEIHSRKDRVKIQRPFQVGIAVYQLAKLRMLEFYYDFLDKYVDRRDFELIQMDTDSLYMAISGKSLNEIVRPELKEDFDKHKRKWLSWDKWSCRTPGLFKPEFEGTRAIALCSKCYYVDDGEKVKSSAKGVNKQQNDITWGRYLNVLKSYVSKTSDSNTDRAHNRGFRMVKGRMMTYEQDKLGLSAYYDKRRLLNDGIHTEPLD